MELRHLRYLEAVADEKSFVAAANKLRVAQPALSRQIKDLEEELGTELLTREAGGSSLTLAGETVVAMARTILHSVREAVRRARLAENGLVGRVVVGVGRFPAAYELCARLIARAREEFPGVHVIVEHLTPADVWERLTTAEIDIGLGIAPPEPRLDFATQTFGHDVLDQAALPENHALTRLETVTLADLRSETYIGLGPNIGSEPIALLYQAFAAKKFEPAATRNALTFDNLRFLIRAGAGWSVFPRSVRQNPDPGIALRAIEDLAVPYRYVVMHRRTEARAVVKCALGILWRESRTDTNPGSADNGENPDRGPPGEAFLRASRLELRHLRYFLSVLEHESIGRAAEALGLAQPTLSKQLKDLEEDVGATLLVRTARGVAPTGAGESFGADARRVVAAADRISLEAARAMRGAAGRVVVGVASTTWIFDLLSRATAEFVRDPSAAELSIEDVPSPRQVASLNEARIDVALGHRYPIVEDVNPNIERVTVVPDTLDVALLPANHPLATKKSIALADLASLPLLFMKREFSPGFHDLVVLTMSRASFVPKLESSYDHLPSIWALVAQGVGWGLGWRGQLARPPQGVVGVPLRDFSLPWGIELSYRRAETRKPVLDVLAAIRKAAAN